MFPNLCDGFSFAFSSSWSKNVEFRLALRFCILIKEKIILPVQSWSDDIVLEEGQDEDETQTVAMELGNVIPFHKLQK